VRLPNAAKQQSLQQAQPKRRILVWQPNERLPFWEVFRFFDKLLDSNPPNRGPHTPLPPPRVRSRTLFNKTPPHHHLKII
jgi:hypothetical protein